MYEKNSQDFFRILYSPLFSIHLISASMEDWSPGLLRAVGRVAQPTTRTTTRDPPDGRGLFPNTSWALFAG